MRRLSLLMVICSSAVSLLSLTVLAFETSHVDASSTWSELDASAVQISQASFSGDELGVTIASSLSFTPAYTSYLPLIHTPPLDPDRIDMMYVTERDGVGWIYLADTERARSMPLAEGQAGSWSPDGNVLAYTRQMNVDDGDIYLVNVDGTGQKALVTGETNDGRPVWSPDGSKLAFSRFSADYYGEDIFVINSDGTGQKALGLEDIRESAPQWSPDGKRLLYWAESPDWPGTGNRLYSVNADGSDRRLLAEDVLIYGHWWSPNGKKILFSKVANDSAEVFVMNADGSGQKNLTNSLALDWHARWSPDGEQIVFSSNRNLQTLYTEEIFVMNSDGSNLIQLSNSQTSGAGWYPYWSPDGEKITFGANSGTDFDVWIVPADGSGPEKPFVVSPGDEAIVVWSPNGQKVGFRSDRDGDWEIFTLKADGTGLRQLTNNQVDDGGFSWRP